MPVNRFKKGPNNCENRALCAINTSQPMKQPEASGKALVPKGFRRLKWDELATCGDFVMNEHRGFELWVGPSGFRAGSFVKPIYRQEEIHSTPHITRNE